MFRKVLWMAMGAFVFLAGVAQAEYEDCGSCHASADLLTPHHSLNENYGFTACYSCHNPADVAENIFSPPPGDCYACHREALGDNGVPMPPYPVPHPGTEDGGACDDGVMNQDETGEDCGGVCGACESDPVAATPGTVMEQNIKQAVSDVQATSTGGGIIVGLEVY